MLVLLVRCVVLVCRLMWMLVSVDVVVLLNMFSFIVISISRCSSRDGCGWVWWNMVVG